MDNEEKENGQELEGIVKQSFFKNKIKGLLDELDEIMDQVGGDYGPVLMEELHNRLEHMVKNFNDEVHTLFTNSFNKWKLTDTQLREFASNRIKVPKKVSSKENLKDSSTPEFIKNIEFGPVKPK